MLNRKLSVLIILAFAIGMLAALPSPASAQEEGSTAVSGQLPPYYKDFVTDAQKKEIYTIQAQYDKKLDALETRYDELTAEIKKLRDSIDEIRTLERAAVEKVLSAKQLAQVKRKQAEAQSKLAQELLKAAEEAAKRAEALSQPDAP